MSIIKIVKITIYKVNVKKCRNRAKLHGLTKRCLNRPVLGNLLLQPSLWIKGNGVFPDLKSQFRNAVTIN